MKSPYHNISIVGCGAIGGLLAERLTAAGRHVTAIDRGIQYEAIRRDGITVIGPDNERRTSKPPQIANHFDLPPQDLIIMAVKAHQIPAIAPDVARLLHADSVLLTLQNGVPWWQSENRQLALAGHNLQCVDPGGTIGRTIPYENILGCVAYPAASVDSPGVVRHTEGNRFPIGEPDGSISARATALSELLQDAGFKAPVLEDLLGEIWLKAWGALAFNPLSILTRGTMVDIATHPVTRALVISMMQEAQAVAEELGVTLRVSLEKRLAGAEKVGHHKTSALQDLENGRASELDAILGSVIEIGKLLGVDTPHLDTVYAACSLLEKKTTAPDSNFGGLLD